MPMTLDHLRGGIAAQQYLPQLSCLVPAPGYVIGAIA